ncbi:MAG: hypothetical protein PSN34_11020 [Urechidicola sp.]|nr:hypothetical protein [Urechidicola sp.]
MKLLKKVFTIIGNGILLLILYNLFIYFDRNFEIQYAQYIPAFLIFIVMGWFVRDYIQFAVAKKKQPHILLSVNNYDYSKFIVIIIMFAFVIFNLKSYSVYYLYFLPFLIIVLYLQFLKSKRRVLVIDKNGINDLVNPKLRKLEEITSLDIHSNNVEIRFNKVEILQINKNDLLLPPWGEFIDNINELKENLQSN